MLIVTDIQNVDTQGGPLVLAMGCFDGVHLGHQKVISTAVDQAEKLGGEAWVYTFNPHPAKVLVPHKAPRLISAEPCRLRQMEALGVQGIIETPFTLEFAKLSPEAFLKDLIARAPSLAGVVCGQDWSFGCRAAGNFQTLEKFGKAHGFTATAIAPVMDGEYKISSTTIRKAIINGDIPMASKLLGRPFSLFGKVVEGKKIGRELGYPTANIDPDNELLPGNGVYAAYTLPQTSEVKNQESGIRNQESKLSPAPCSLTAGYPSAVFIGTRKTFGCQQHVIESYLLDFDGDLYGKTLEVVLIEKTRDIHPFPSREALIEQIKKDVARIRDLLSRHR
ncbi:MAG: bifunctional riboflavin kinase/FMN adenylyltransferase [Kiritimatiellales bacterium]|nr:bifunctional riboflavin kinase/FMN adenylyltransferase [Kiritimatiellota bacterium]MBL7011455.1 bifunctional riboflavin kinase/FMN adenylyltransferase [Kiritimatiellales bacterium]